MRDISNSTFTVVIIDEDSKYQNLVPELKPYKYILLVNNKPLKTPKGEPFINDNELLFKHMIFDELELKDKLDPSEFSLYSMFCTFKDFIENAEDFLIVDLEELLLGDIVLKTCAGPEVVDQLYRHDCISKFFSDNHLKRLFLPQTIDNKQTREWIKKYGSESGFLKLVSFFSEALRTLTDVQRCVIVNSVNIHNSFLLGYLLATNRCSPSEYANALLSAECLLSSTFGEVSKEEQKEMLEGIKSDVNTLRQFQEMISPIHPLRILIEKGESRRLEFKSTLRLNLHTQNVDKKMEHSAMKTIAAFLNSEGGKLLVGVSDSGEILGADLDTLPNEDKFLLHFKNLLDRHIGLSFIPLIHYELVEIVGKKILEVDCDRSDEAVFLKAGSDEEFYVRTGPSSDKLDGKRLLDYIKRHFGNE